MTLTFGEDRPNQYGRPIALPTPTHIHEAPGLDEMKYITLMQVPPETRGASARALT